MMPVWLNCNKKNEKKQTHYMTKKLFCQLNHEYLPLQYFGDGFNKIGILKKITEFKKKNIKIKSFVFSKYTCFLLLGMLQFNT
jgi:hypothetical protein